MKTPRLGVSADDFGLGPKRGLRQASRLGFRAVELAATRGDLDASKLSRSAKRHLLKYAEGLGLVLAMLDGRLGPTGLTDPARAEECVERTRRILELASRIRVPVIATHLGQVPDDADHPRRRMALDALDALAEHADKTGTALAVETAQASPEQIRLLIEQINSPLVRVCYDPGALLIHGHDPLAGLASLGDHVAASYLRDGLPGSREAAGREVRLGTGQVDLAAYLDALGDDYTGPHMIRRAEASDPAADIAAGKEHAERLLR